MSPLLTLTSHGLSLKEDAFHRWHAYVQDHMPEITVQRHRYKSAEVYDTILYATPEEETSIRERIPTLWAAWHREGCP